MQSSVAMKQSFTHDERNRFFPVNRAEEEEEEEIHTYNAVFRGNETGLYSW